MVVAADAPGSGAGPFSAPIELHPLGRRRDISMTDQGCTFMGGHVNNF
jgi:hypothetical protein